MADSQTTWLTKLLVGGSLITAAAVGGVQLYVSGAGHFTGNMTGSGSLVVEDSITSQGLISADAGITVTGTMTGGSLKIQASGTTATGSIRVTGGTTASGGALCLQDTDAAGYSVVTALNGTLTTRAAQADECL